MRQIVQAYCPNAAAAPAATPATPGCSKLVSLPDHKLREFVLHCACHRVILKKVSFWFVLSHGEMVGASVSGVSWRETPGIESLPENMCKDAALYFSRRLLMAYGRGSGLRLSLVLSCAASFADRLITVCENCCLVINQVQAAWGFSLESYGEWRLVCAGWRRWTCHFKLASSIRLKALSQ